MRAPIHKRLVVPVGISAVAITFITMVAVIYYFSWWKRPAAPTVVLIFRGDDRLKTYADATVTINMPQGRLTAPFMKTDDPQYPYQCKFHLAPGEYGGEILLANKRFPFTLTLPEYTRNCYPEPIDPDRLLGKR